MTRPPVQRLQLRIAMVALLVASAGPAAAQGPTGLTWPRAEAVELKPPPRMSVAPLRAGAAWPTDAATLPLGDSAAIPRTYWKAGAIVGGSVFGVAGAGAAWGLCHDENPCRAPIWPTLGAFVLVGGLGAVLGALIGGQIPAGAP
jgi:peptidoglycan/LPS O-acetylase OafA/YrhL